MTAPYRRNTAESILGNVLDRLRILEAIRPQLSAMYEIKVFGDSEEVTSGSGLFQFAIPFELNGWTLTSASGFVSTPSGSGDVEVMVENLTEAVNMLSTDITIPDGDTCGDGVVEAADAGVSDCDLISINVDSAGSGAMGLGVILRFAA